MKMYVFDPDKIETPKDMAFFLAATVPQVGLRLPDGEVDKLPFKHLLIEVDERLIEPASQIARA